MAEEKTLEEVIFDLLKRGFQIQFECIQSAFDNTSIEFVHVKLKKRIYVLERRIEIDYLAYGLLVWADEFDKMLEAKEIQYKRKVEELNNG